MNILNDLSLRFYSVHRLEGKRAIRFTDKHVNAFIGNGHLDSQPPYVLVCGHRPVLRGAIARLYHLNPYFLNNLSNAGTTRSSIK